MVTGHRFAGLWVAVFVIGSQPAWAQESATPFDSGRWSVADARIGEHLGRTALSGAAFLKDAEFENGVIEFDLAVTGARSYPGVIFRSLDDGSWERIYIRPHRTGRLSPPLYPDVVQYVPSFHQADSWQLYNGDGLTAGAEIPVDRWFHVKVEVSGVQARVYLDRADAPVLRITDLKQGRRKGGLGLVGPLDGSAYFADFSYREDEGLDFETPPPTFPVPGIIREWQLSRCFPSLNIDLEKPPEQQGLTGLDWQPVSADASGLVDVSRFHGRSGQPDAVFARTVIQAGEERSYKLNLGYSDFVSLFLNGRLVFSGASPYRGRDPSFLGIVGLFDTICLPLRRGENEVLLLVSEMSGGWGYIAQDGDAVAIAPGVSKIWETGKEFLFPESAAYDPRTKALYVSNTDAFNRSADQGLQSVSKIDLDGRIEKRDWVAGLKNPTGLAVYKGRLYVAEPRSLVEIDIAKARIVGRHEWPGAVMFNDVAVDARGTVYLSDFRKNVLVRYTKDGFEEWLSGPEVSQPNGLCLWQGRLLWGNCGDGKVKAADLRTKSVDTIAALGSGIIDGIAAGPDGGILVSHNEGRLFLLSAAGEVTRLLDSSVIQQRIADFEYLPEPNLVVYPTWMDNRVVAYRLGGAFGRM